MEDQIEVWRLLIILQSQAESGDLTRKHKTLLQPTSSEIILNKLQSTLQVIQQFETRVEEEVDLSEIFSHDDDDEAQHVIPILPITGPPGGSPTDEVAETER